MDILTAYFVMSGLCWLCLLGGLCSYIHIRQITFLKGILVFVVCGLVCMLLAMLWPFIALVYSYQLGKGPEGKC